MKAFKLFGIPLLSLFFFVSASKALVSDYVPEESVAVVYTIAVAANVTTTTLIIDRSDTTTWPHSNNE